LLHHPTLIAGCRPGGVLFVPDEDVAGEPGALTNVPLFEIRHLSSYRSSFVGTSEAMLEFTVEYTVQRMKHQNPHLQHCRNDEGHRGGL
jgi:hypothetical protein